VRVKLDENIPVGLVAEFAAAGHDATTVSGQGLSGASDPQVWQAVQNERRLLVTMDLDFSDMRRYPPGSHAGILLLRPHRDGRKAIIGLVTALLECESLDGLAGCLAVADEAQTRVRRPPEPTEGN
jgi:predicted nuclease of predicted toxin-antitoxin system